MEGSCDTPDFRLAWWPFVVSVIWRAQALLLPMKGNCPSASRHPPCDSYSSPGIFKSPEGASSAPGAGEPASSSGLAQDLPASGGWAWSSLPPRSLGICLGPWQSPDTKAEGGRSQAGPPAVVPGLDAPVTGAGIAPKTISHYAAPPLRSIPATNFLLKLILQQVSFLFFLICTLNLLIGQLQPESNVQYSQTSRKNKPAQRMFLVLTLNRASPLHSVATPGEKGSIVEEFPASPLIPSFHAICLEPI